MEDEEFIEGKLDTGFIERFNERKKPPEISEEARDMALIAAALGYSGAKPAAAGHGPACFRSEPLGARGPGGIA